MLFGIELKGKVTERNAQNEFCSENERIQGEWRAWLLRELKCSSVLRRRLNLKPRMLYM